MKPILIALFAFVCLGATADAKLIQMAGRYKFSESESIIVEAVNRAFLKELTSLEYGLSVKKLKDQDPFVNSTEFNDMDITIKLSRATRDDFQFAGILCHELGHVLSHSKLITSEMAYFRDYVPGYTNVEGECDYFAAMKCIPRIVEVLPKAELSKVCIGSPDPSRCAIVAKVGQRTIDAMIARDANHNRGEVNFETRTWIMDPATTFSGYQDYACRLQTWKAGAWCGVDPMIAFSTTDEKAGACVEGAGSRPRCWYVPGTSPKSSRY